VEEYGGNSPERSAASWKLQLVFWALQEDGLAGLEQLVSLETMKDEHHDHQIFCIDRSCLGEELEEIVILGSLGI
jgi:hypothetical protein